LHNEELYNLYTSTNIIKWVKSRTVRWAGHVTRMEEKRKVYKILLGKQEGKIPLGRPRRRWKYWIRKGLREVGWGCGLDLVGSG
jgi:hypothetical protein